MTDQQLATTEQKPRPSMTVGGNVGALIPQDIDQAFRIAQALAHSGMTPNGFKSPETCFVAIMAGAELGLPPFQSLQSFAIINNRPTLWGDALMAVVRTNGFKVREWLEGAGDEMEAFCEVIRPDNGDVAEASFSVSDAKTAGLWKKGGPWTTNPKRMLKMRARAFAIRDGAADVLRGFQIREEVEDYGEPIPAEAGQAKAGTGLLAKLQTNETLATEGFGIRDIQEEAGEASPAPEPATKKRGRPAKSKVEELAQQASEGIQNLERGVSAMQAVAEAEPEIVAQVVEDHGSQSPATAEAMTEAGVMDPAQTEALENLAPEAEAILDGPAPAGVRYFHADKEAFASGRRVVFVNGQPEKETADATDDLPTYAEHAARPKPAPAAEEQAEPTAGSQSPSPSDESTSASTTASQDGGATTASPFDIFDAAARDATDWPELSAALTDLARNPEWRSDADAKRAARLKAWAKVCDWNEDGAKLDPARSANLFQIAVTAYSDPEVIQGLYATAQGEAWLTEADEGMQAGVARFVMDRLAEIRGA